VITVAKNKLNIELHRISFSASAVAAEIKKHRLPLLYAEMYLRGRKLN